MVLWLTIFSQLKKMPLSPPTRKLMEHTVGDARAPTGHREVWGKGFLGTPLAHIEEAGSSPTCSPGWTQLHTHTHLASQGNISFLLLYCHINLTSFFAFFFYF